MTINTRNDILAGLDDLIARVLVMTGADQVDILGHSHGTTIMHDYPGRPEGPERAEKIAHYVNIDGRSSDTPPGSAHSCRGPDGDLRLGG